MLSLPNGEQVLSNLAQPIIFAYRALWIQVNVMIVSTRLLKFYKMSIILSVPAVQFKIFNIANSPLNMTTGS